MAEQDPFSGFPPGEITFRTLDEKLVSRIHTITEQLVEDQAEHAPAVTYELYTLNLAAPSPEDESQAALALR